MDYEQNNNTLMKISEIEKTVGASRKALQEYDKLGMVHPTAKTEGGYWLYDEKAVDRIRTIQLFSMIGYTRKEIKEFLDTVTGFEHPEKRKELYREAIERLKKKKDEIDGLIGIAETMYSLTDLPKDTLTELQDYKKGGVFSEASAMDTLQQKAEWLAEQDEQSREQITQIISLMGPYAGKLMALSCHQEEAPTSEAVQEKVEEVFEEWKTAYTSILRLSGEYTETETIEEKPLTEQLDAFRGFTETTLGGQEETVAGDYMEMMLNRRYGASTGEKIREMIEVFVEKKKTNKF